MAEPISSTISTATFLGKDQLWVRREATFELINSETTSTSAFRKRSTVRSTGEIPTTSAQESGKQKGTSSIAFASRSSSVPITTMAPNFTAFVPAPVVFVGFLAAPRVSRRLTIVRRMSHRGAPVLDSESCCTGQESWFAPKKMKTIKMKSNFDTDLNIDRVSVFQSRLKAPLFHCFNGFGIETET